MERTDSLMNSLLKAGFNVKMENPYTLIVFHEWRNEEEKKESLAANRRATDIAIDHSPRPRSILATKDFKETVIKMK